MGSTLPNEPATGSGGKAVQLTVRIDRDAEGRPVYALLGVGGRIGETVGLNTQEELLQQFDKLLLRGGSGRVAVVLQADAEIPPALVEGLADALRGCQAVERVEIERSQPGK